MTIQNGQVADADEVIKSIGVTTAQLAYFGVKSDSTNWANENYLGADIFTDSNGAKGTIDTTNSTARWSDTNDAYVLGFTDEASGDTTHDPDSATNPENAFDNANILYYETPEEYIILWHDGKWRYKARVPKSEDFFRENLSYATRIKV